MSVDEALLRQDETIAYPFALANLPGTELTYIEPAPMWEALLADLKQRTPVPVMAARFHQGLAKVISTMVQRLAHQCQEVGFPVNTVALSGGCLQNKTLLEEVTCRLEGSGFECLSQGKVPSNDGGLALGQAAIAASRQL